MWTFFDTALFVIGYAAAIYSWPKIRLWINGIGAEAADLRRKAERLEARLRSL